MEKEIKLLVQHMKSAKMFEIIPNRAAKDYFTSPNIIFSNSSNLQNQNFETDINQDILTDSVEENTEGMLPLVDDITEGVSDIPEEYQEEFIRQQQKNTEHTQDQEQEQNQQNQKEKQKINTVATFDKFILLTKQGERKKLRYYITKIIPLFPESKELLANLLILFPEITSFHIDKAVHWLYTNWRQQRVNKKDFNLLCAFLELELPNSIFYSIPSFFHLPFLFSFCIPSLFFLFTPLHPSFSFLPPSPFTPHFFIFLFSLLQIIF